MDKVKLNTPVILVEDRVDEKCMRHIHLMSNVQIIAWGDGSGTWICEGGVWHYRAVYPYRGILDFPFACAEGHYRRLVVWNLDGYELIKPALHDAWDAYLRAFHGAPQFAFMKKLPDIVPNGYEVAGMTMIETSWMLENCVAVGCKL